MRAYYEQRAREYDDWWLGTGLFAERDRPGWDEEVDRLADVLAALPPRRVLDVACGTGFLTRHLRGAVTALDQSASMVAIARERLPGAEVVHAEALPLPFADGAFDRVVTGHFYGHLLEGVRGRRPARGPRAGRYKRFFTGPGLAAELGGGRVLHDGRWFVVVAGGS